jgi:hypothetical protein
MPNHNRRTIAVLLAAGLAYAWNNRERLSQQLRAFTGRMDDSPPSGPRYALPDLKDREIRDFDLPAQELNEREINGTRM